MRVALVTLLAVLALAAPAAAEDRLDRAAKGLGASPLHVHPELQFLIPERDRQLIVQHLREANVPVRREDRRVALARVRRERRRAGSRAVGDRRPALQRRPGC